MGFSIYLFIIDLQFNFVMVKEHTLYNINFSKYVKAYFTAKYMACLSECSCKLKTNVYTTIGRIFYNCLYLSTRSSWLIMFKSYISLKVDYLFGLSVTKKRLLKSPGIIDNSFISSLSSISIWLIYFEALSLCANKFRIVIYFWRTDFLSLCNGLLYPYLSSLLWNILCPY